MAQKRKPNIIKKNPQEPVIKTDPIVISKPEPVKTYAKSKAAESKNHGFLFDKRNYLLMLAGIVFIVLGLIIMAGGGSDNPNVFNPDIFNTQRLTVAPILILLGFVIEVFAIMLKPREKADA